MPKYLAMFSYSPEAMAAMIENPADREPAIRHVLESVGASLEVFYWMFGEHDGLAIYEVPDAVTAGAVALAVATTGMVSDITSHQLLDSDEVRLALERAASLAPVYQPPGAPWREDYDALG